jgi:hypothetical protein
MSRYAQAQKRAGVCVATETMEDWGFARAGEDLADTAFTPTRLAPSAKVRVFPDRSLNAPARAPLFQPGVVARAGSLDPRVELSALVTRVFSMPPAGAGARSALFCTVDEDGRSNAVARDAAQMMAQQAGRPVGLVHVRVDSEPIDAESAGEPGLSEFSMDLATAQTRFEEFLDQFAFVLLVASQPVITAPVIGLARAVDATVLLISEAFTRRQAAKTMVAELQASGASLLGVVLTDRTCPIPAGIYRRL